MSYLFIDFKKNQHFLYVNHRKGFLVALFQEACCVGMNDALHDEDSVITAYRAHGWTLMKGRTMTEVLAELTGISISYGDIKFMSASCCVFLLYSPLSTLP